ncbi:MAG: DUF5362 family protein [Kiritimatiellaeota bacterium]|nr:DUF5362 family protein [Kiritimatiellota bacterium]
MEKNWCYSADGQDKKGPMPESELKQLLAGGQIPAGTLVWSEGMANWAPASSVAALQQQSAVAASPAAAAMATPAAATGGAQIPAGLTSWMTFVAVMKMIHGVILCLTCIGAIAGVPKIISSVNFLNAKNLLATMPAVDPAMLPFLEKLRVGFKALGWSIIGLFIMVVVVIILELVLFATLFTRMPH